MSPILILILAMAGIVSSSIKFVNEYERLVVFRFGRLQKQRGPGLSYVLPWIETARRVDTRLVTMDVPSQDVITRDNISVKVNAVVYFWVFDATKAIVGVENYLYATQQLAQTELRSLCGEVELDELLANRDRLNMRLQETLDPRTDNWGIKVKDVQLKHIDLPPEMQRAMAAQAEAERERRAKVIAAEGEFQASQKLAEAAKVLGTEPQAIQLRYLQTLREISNSGGSSTTIFPVPIDFLQSFVGKRAG
jgi:regulator of protease activity HflC (stomatin/prohibitin superfamily)